MKQFHFHLPFHIKTTLLLIAPKLLDTLYEHSSVYDGFSTEHRLTEFQRVEKGFSGGRIAKRSARQSEERRQEEAKSERGLCSASGNFAKNHGK